jgi:molybdopterin molybdotransferase
MISQAEAKELIRNNTKPLAPATFALPEAAGLTLAEDIFALNDFPPFRQSAMDGYAFSFSDWNHEPLSISGEVQAGAAVPIKTTNKQAVRIFTGAPVPDTVDTVVMQEKVLVEDGMLRITDEALKQGTNVRNKGAEIKTGDLGLQVGTHLSPGAIGFIAGLGIGQVKATPMPVISIIVTGKELQSPGKNLSFGQVYESNSFALTAALKQVGISGVSTQWVDDDPVALTEVIQTELLKADLVLLTGGVSVGDYDFVTQALEQTGVQKIFHRVKQRPGKPLFFGKKGDKLVFGLPGNPSSVLTCFYEYVLVAIQHLMAKPLPFIKAVQLPIGADYNKTTGLTHFLKARHADGQVMPLDAQESYRMRSFAMANCLIVLDEDRSNYMRGELVEVHLLF